MRQSSIKSFKAGLASDIKVKSIIRGLNCRSCSPLHVPAFIFKKYALIVIVVISKLVNASIADVQFPEILKVTR